MKTVNFIEAVKYAKRGKEVYFKLLEKKYYLVSYTKGTPTDIFIPLKYRDIFILDEYSYKRFIENKDIHSRENHTKIEFYLNEWIVKDEEEDLILPVVPCEYEPKSLYK